MEIPLLDKGGNSAWPERFPAEKANAMRKRAGPNKFDSQMMLKPVNILEGRLNPDRLCLYEGELAYSESQGQPVLHLGQKRLVGASAWWDPAYGVAGKGDASVVAAVYQDEEGGWWLHRIRYLTLDPNSKADEASQLCDQVAAFLAPLHMPAIRVETNGLGRFLPGLLRKSLLRHQVGASVLEVHSTKSKDQRILDAFDAPMAAGMIFAHASIWKTPFITKMREWQPAAKAKDDGLDAVAGCLLAQPVRLNAPKRLASPVWHGASPTKAQTQFDP